MEPQRRLYVVLDGPDFRRLAELAERERRPVRDQAGWLIQKELRRRGLGADQDTRSAAVSRTK